MLVDLVSVETADGVRLDGALRTPPQGTPQRLGLDLVICHHGQAGNFYGSYMFNGIGDHFLEGGCSVLRVHSRGHHHMAALGRPSGPLGGAVYEVIEDS